MNENTRRIIEQFAASQRVRDAKDAELKEWALTKRSVTELQEANAPSWLIGWWNRYHNGDYSECGNID